MTQPSVSQAVRHGHLTVTLPVLTIVALCCALGYTLLGHNRIGLAIGMMAGTLVGWTCWSAMVPRWRDWIVDRGLTPDDVQDAAVRAALLWPRGLFFERTEFRRRDGRRGW